MKRWELPDGWIWTTVGEVGDVRLGRQRTPEHHNGPNMRPYLRVANVMEGCIDTSDVMQMNFTDAEFKTFQLRNGDVLLNEGQTKALVGRPAIFRGEVPGACFQNTLIRFRAHEGVMPEYAFQLFRHYMHAGHFSEIAQITTSIAHLGGDRFAMRPFPLPPLPEQQRIVDRLNALQARIQRARADLAELRELAAALKRSALDAAFRGELTATWRAEHPDAEPAETLLERLRVERRRRWEAAHPKKTYVPPKPIDPAGLPELPEGWCWAALEEIATSSLGKMLDKNKNHGTLRPYLRNQNVRWRRFDLDDVGLMRFEEDEEARFGLRADDVLVCEGGEPGRAAVWGEQRSAMRFQKALHRVRCSRYLLPDWLVFQLAWHAETGLLQEYCTGTGIAHLTGESLARVPIALPPEAEQVLGCRRLTSTWDTWERAIETTHALSDDLTTTEHALLTAAFRGDLVPQHPDDEPADALLKRLQAQAAAEEGRRRRR